MLQRFFFIRSYKIYISCSEAEQLTVLEQQAGVYEVYFLISALKRCEKHQNNFHFDIKTMT